jgi:hypothetical protein
MYAVISKVIACLLEHGENLLEVKLLRKTYDIDILVEIEFIVSLKNCSKVS